VGLRAGLDRCEKSRPYRDSIPGPSSPYPVAVPITLSVKDLFIINHIPVFNIQFYIHFSYNFTFVYPSVAILPVPYIYVKEEISFSKVI